MTEREARIAFNMIPTVGAVAVERLAREAGGSAAEAYARFPEKRDWEGREPDWRRELERAEKTHVRIVTQVDDDYPPLLNEIASPPLALYVVGDAAALARASVAIVGTRGASPYGRDMAEKFACGLAQRGWCVLSGLARGIDTYAHRGALVGGGVTVGVLGGALDRFYPEENRGLAREMVEKGGAVVSEFPFGRAPDPQTFPQRNRVVSGLSRGVVAVESPAHGGTLITCMRAAEQGRAVMAVPGRIDNRNSAGCLKLIRDGARMVTCVDDVVEELSSLPELGRMRPSGERGQASASPPVKKSAPPAVPEAKVTADEAAVLGAVPDEGCGIDRVVRATGFGAARVNTLLMGLRLKGRLAFLPGNRVSPKKTF